MSNGTPERLGMIDRRARIRVQARLNALVTAVEEAAAQLERVLDGAPDQVSSLLFEVAVRLRDVDESASATLLPENLAHCTWDQVVALGAAIQRVVAVDRRLVDAVDEVLAHVPPSEAGGARDAYLALLRAHRRLVERFGADAKRTTSHEMCTTFLADDRALLLGGGVQQITCQEPVTSIFESVRSSAGPIGITRVTLHGPGAIVEALERALRLDVRPRLPEPTSPSERNVGGYVARVGRGHVARQELDHLLMNLAEAISWFSDQRFDRLFLDRLGRGLAFFGERRASLFTKLGELFAASARWPDGPVTASTLLEVLDLDIRTTYGAAPDASTFSAHQRAFLEAAKRPHGAIRRPSSLSAPCVRQAGTIRVLVEAASEQHESLAALARTLSEPTISLELRRARARDATRRVSADDRVERLVALLDAEPGRSRPPCAAELRRVRSAAQSFVAALRDCLADVELRYAPPEVEVLGRSFRALEAAVDEASATAGLTSTRNA